MHIHNYQIHNVLNAYRKQLSQSPEKSGSKRPGQPAPKDMVSLSQQGQQPSIVNKISAEIIDRMAQFEPKTEFESVLADQLTAPSAKHPKQTSGNGVEFTYSLIDEHNRKTTHSIPIQGLDTQHNELATEHTLSPDLAKEQPQIKELFNNQQDASKKWKG